MEEQIVRTYADMIYRIACRYTGNTTDADDVFSETFLRYFRKERHFESEEHRKAWLIRVTVNCAKEFLAQRSKYVSLDDQQPMAAAAPDTDGNLDLYNAIEALPADYREVIKLHYLDGLSVKQLSQILDRNENTVKTHLLRGRQMLKTYLEA